MPADLAVETRALTHRYGRHTALKGIDLQIPAKSICALVGANGAGKTTLIKILANLVLPTSGSATLLDKDSKLLSGADMRRLGYVSENQQLPLWMTTRSYLAYLRPFYPNWDTTLESKLLGLLDIPMDRKLKHLSRGQIMKTAFVSTLSFRPSLVILDEPFSGLDPLVREELIAALRDVATDPAWPATFLISSHDLDEIEALATHLIYVDQGNVLFADPLADVRGRFRQVRFTLPEAISLHFVPLPSGWLDARLGTDNTVAFTYAADSTERGGADIVRRAVLQAFPAASDIESSPLSLRNIFLSVARDRRTLLSHGRREGAA